MITEDYVSDETFKLLKEKSFDDSCCRFVIESDETYYRGAPTLQMAMKWLREVHKICIVIYPFTHRERGTYTSDICSVTMTMEEGHLRGVWNSYEEACEAAIKYCLENLI